MNSILLSTFNHNRHVKSVLITVDKNESRSSNRCSNNCPKNYLIKSTESSKSINKFTLIECNEFNQINKCKFISLIYKYEIDHYILFLFLILLNESSILKQKYFDHFIQPNKSHQSAQLIIKFRLNDTPVYPLLKSWYAQFYQFFYEEKKIFFF